MAEINLLESYPRAKRDFSQRRAVSPEDRALAKKFGREYFDGTRDQGYGGYSYDGRWLPVARRMKDHYKLPDNARILDIGCAKGFLMHDFKQLYPEMEVFGLDISAYAVANSMDDVKAHIVQANAAHVPFGDKSFDLVIAINTIHNLAFEQCADALREIMRVTRSHSYVQVDSYHNDAERQNLLDWILTARTYMSQGEWRKFFDDAGYKGDYFWTVF